MTGEEVLAFAASHGVRATLAVGDLHLEADHEPPAEALAALRDHKEAVVVEDVGRIAAAAGERRRIFEAHVATIACAACLGKKPSASATRSFSSSSSTTHPDTDPSRCGCGLPETQSNILLPIGVSIHKT
jgi:hypothetical protein